LFQRDFVDEVLLLTSANTLLTPGLPALDAVDRARIADKAQYDLAEDRMVGADRLRRYERQL
jgi:hypothetical protein